MAGLTEVPVRVIEADDRRTAELALVENLQREDLNPLEEAMGYRSLIDEFGLTQDEAARSVGKSRSAVSNSLRLLSLTPKVLEMVQNGRISAGHARALLPIVNGKLQEDAAEEVFLKGLSVRSTEQLAARMTRMPALKEKRRQRIPWIMRRRKASASRRSWHVSVELWKENVPAESKSNSIMQTTGKCCWTTSIAWATAGKTAQNAGNNN